jgi:hypothetical protein
MQNLAKRQDINFAGKTFYFQTDDLKKNWAWSIRPIPPQPEVTYRPDNVPTEEYGSGFSSVFEMLSALTKLTRGSFEVCWVGSTREVYDLAIRTRKIYQDEVFREAVYWCDAFTVAKDLAYTNRTNTWVVTAMDGEVVGVFRFPLSDVS